MATDPATNLTDKQRKFCQEYLLDGNAAAAYQRAGYVAKPAAARRNASRLLTNADIQAYLDRLRRETSAAAAVSLERTLSEIGAIAFSNISDVMRWGQNGITLKDSVELPPEVARAIASVEVVASSAPGDGTRRKVTMHPKMTALSLLADYFGIKDDFNQARATLKRYGLALLEDPTAPTGWKVEPYEG